LGVFVNGEEKNQPQEGESDQGILLQAWWQDNPGQGVHPQKVAIFPFLIFTGGFYE